MSEKRKVGRPKLFQTPAQMQEKIDDYFDHGRNTVTIRIKGIEIEKPIITLSGMIYYLGFSSREGFYKYGDYPEFSDTVKRAQLRVATYYEEMLQVSSNVTAPIFVLKCMGWDDKNGQSDDVAQDEPIIFKANGLQLKVG